jgi:hypothetical protein
MPIYLHMGLSYCAIMPDISLKHKENVKYL